MPARTPAPIDLHLHPKQGEALQTPATEVLYGGAAGGGKSHLMRVAAIIWCAAIPGLQVYLFRRIREDLVKNHMQGPKSFPALLAPWVVAGLVTIVEDEIRFWNGSKIYLCHCKDEKDRFKYLGAEIHVLLIDELTTFTEVIYRFLRGRVRAVGLDLPPQYAGQFPRILCGSNPGNVGHLWVKAAFVDPAPPMTMRAMNDNEGGMVRQFIPARLDDNPSMAADDPNYRARLRGLGSEALVRAMEQGDWNIVEGAFFDCWRTDLHVIRPFAIPPGWLRFCSFDWGSARPFSNGWWAVSDGSLLEDGRRYPTGALIRYREWYGASAPNVGLKLTAEQIAAGIRERELPHEKIAYRVADPAVFKVDGGPSHAERMGNLGVHFTPADNSRIAGWDQLRGRMIGIDGEPMIYCFETCVDSIRTIPAAQHDEKRPEDVDSDGEDHCFAAGTMVETDVGPVPIELLPPTGRVLSVDGYRPYYGARMTRRAAATVRLIFENGTVIQCTPDHKFLDESDEWRYAADLFGRSIACVRPLSATPSRSLAAPGTTSAGDISREGESAYMWLFGNINTAQFRPDVIFTIATMIAATISPKTWSAYQPLSICAPVTATPLLSGASGPSMRPAPELRPGTGAMRAGVGTASISNGTFGRSWIAEFLRRARSVAVGISSPPQGSSRASSALARARPVRCVAVEGAERADVYCLTVPETAAFAVEGGLIVHNCLDDWRYACMSRPWVKPLEQTHPNANHPLAFRNLVEAARRRRLSEDAA